MAEGERQSRSRSRANSLDNVALSDTNNLLPNTLRSQNASLSASKLSKMNSKYSMLSDSSGSGFGSREKFPWQRRGSFWRRVSNYSLLTFLYFLQGLPLGLVHGTIPMMLKSKKGNDLTFTDLGLFSMSAYPYSLKLLWSPLVDSLFFRQIGRRKSWILPTQFLIGIGFIIIGSFIDNWISHADADIFRITIAFTLLVLLCATQDIAVDGWALTLLDPDQVHFSSTCQTIGLNTGYFVTYTIFLALSSPEFCNNYLRSIPGLTGMVEISSFLKFWGVVSIVATVGVAFLKRESPPPLSMPLTLQGAYATILRIMALSNVKRLVFILLLARIGFIPIDAVAPLKLIEKGFPREMMAVTVLIDFPIQLAIGFFAAKWTQGPTPLWAWQKAVFLKLIFCIFSIFVIASFPGDGVITKPYFLLVVAMTICSSFASTVAAVSMSAFFSTISDPAIGGTYMTLLNTVSNIGGMWPKLLVLSGVDWTTKRSCNIPVGIEVDNLPEAAMYCANEVGILACQSVGGSCRTSIDGFYIMTILCCITGLILTVKVIIPIVKQLEVIPTREWQVNTIPTHLLNAIV